MRVTLSHAVAGVEVGRKALCVGLPAAMLLCASTPLRATAISMDGRFDDWSSVAALHTDSLGDVGASDVDFHRVWAAHDDSRFFIRFEIGADKKAQESQSIVLYIDSDANAGTGLAVGNMGAEFAWKFGQRNGTAYNSSGAVAGTAQWFACGAMIFPTHSSTEFEAVFNRSAVVAGVPLFAGSTVGLLLRNEAGGVQDQTPNNGQQMFHTFGATTPTSTPVIPLGRRNAQHVRILSNNVLNDTLFSDQPPFQRLYQAASPDIFCFQEIYTHSATQTRDLIQTFLGGTWYAAEIGDCITVSRYPILTTRDISGNLGTLINLPDAAYTQDIYVINVHLPCCANDSARQGEVDATVSWIRDLKTAGGVETLAANTPIVVTGDTNFVGWKQQVMSLQTGDIQDETTYGPDHAPDWDSGSLQDVLPRHCADTDVFSWYSPTSSYCPGRLDYFFVTDSVAAVARSYILWTPSMAPADLTAAGLLSSDSTTADHSPLVLDLAPAGIPVPIGISTFGLE